MLNLHKQKPSGAGLCVNQAGGLEETLHEKTLTDSNPNSAIAQRARLLAALKLNAVTTLSARRDMDVMHPAARIMELRALGNDISMTWSRELSDSGEHHRVGRYTLMSLAPTVGGAA